MSALGVKRISLISRLMSANSGHQLLHEGQLREIFMWRKGVVRGERGQSGVLAYWRVAVLSRA